MSAMYPHRATIWHKGPESEKRATWVREDVPACRFEHVRGAARAMQGEASQDSVSMLVPDEGFRASDGDRIAEGASAEAEPPKGSYEVVCAEAVDLVGFDHWEVSGR